MGTPAGYSLSAYGEMMTDQTRMDAYVQALKQAVRPGSIVLDIGAGTGIFALLSCQFGAEHVHAVEPHDAIQVAREIGAANGYADRITFHQKVSTAIALPRRADVIISDLHGALPLFQHHIPSIIDARERLLAPGGTLIPRRDTIWAALVEDAEAYKPYAEPWRQNGYDLDMRAALPLVVNSWRKVNAKAEHLLVPPQQWATLDYCDITAPDVAGELSWTIGREGTAHGLLLWFDAELAEGIGFSNAPGEPKLVYGQGFFPFEQPLNLAAGERVDIRVAADLTGNDYTWRWDTTAFSAENQPRARFRQSTFFGSPLSLDSLRKRSDKFTPLLSKKGQVDLLVLDLMAQQVPLGDIARQVAERFPARFESWKEALAHVSDLSERYAR